MFGIFEMSKKIDAIMWDVQALLLRYGDLVHSVRDMQDYLKKKPTTRILYLETSIENGNGNYQRLSEETISYPEKEIFRSILIPHDMIPDMKAAWASRIAIRINTREEKN